MRDMRKLCHKSAKIRAKYWGVEDYFPEEIVNEILLRLPIKSIIKCSAVCKSWNALIKSPTFIQTHLRNSQNDDVHLLLLRAVAEEELLAPYSLHLDNPALGEYTKLITPIFNNRPIKNRVIGTCNGIVCLSAYSIDYDCFIALWNPSIRKFGILPKHPTVTKSHAKYVFCYDSRVNDYMVLRIVGKSFLGETPCEALEFWSLAKGSWKSVSAIPAHFRPYSGVHAFVNGAVHWVQFRHEDEDRFTSSIVTFDMVNESFGEVPLRKAVGECPPYVSRYGEFLAVFEYLSSSTLDMWVMTEYGVAESWTKLFTVSDEDSCIQPYGFRKSGEVIIQTDSRMLKSVDPKSKQVKDFGIDGYKDYYLLNSFVQSLVLLDQPNTISY